MIGPESLEIVDCGTGKRGYPTFIKDPCLSVHALAACVHRVFSSFLAKGEHVAIPVPGRVCSWGEQPR